MKISDHVSYKAGVVVVINRVITPHKWPYKCVTGVIIPTIGVITSFITGRGPPFWGFADFHWISSLQDGSEVSWYSGAFHLGVR